MSTEGVQVGRGQDVGDRRGEPVPFSTWAANGLGGERGHPVHEAGRQIPNSGARRSSRRPTPHAGRRVRNSQRATTMVGTAASTSDPKCAVADPAWSLPASSDRLMARSETADEQTAVHSRRPRRSLSDTWRARAAPRSPRRRSAGRPRSRRARARRPGGPGRPASRRTRSATAATRAPSRAGGRMRRACTAGMRAQRVLLDARSRRCRGRPRRR